MTQNQPSSVIHKAPGTIVQVAVPLPIRRATPLIYDYHLPDGQMAEIGMIVEVPLGKRFVWGIIMDMTPSGDVVMDKLKPIHSWADLPPLTPSHISFLRHVSDWTMAPFGMVMRMMLSTPKAHNKPKPTTFYHSSEAADEGDVKLTPKRARILSFLAQGHHMTANDLAAETATSPAIIKTMAKQGLIAQVSTSIEADLRYHDIAHEDLNLVSLSSDQQAIADGLSSHLEQGYSAHLLDGVTGSGKTEVYFDLVARMMARKKQILILLPEIALTSQWQTRFEARFGQKPLIWHSSVSEANRRDYWRACIRGEPVIVVGARSALFLPFTDLGLIIVDEEHEQAFKQEDMVIYQARDMAVMRAHIEQVPVILATATPSLESWVNAGQGSDDAKSRYHHWRLTTRVGHAQMPDITMIDLKRDKPPAGRWLSQSLLSDITRTLEAGEQTLLYLNRRGYAPLSICEACGTKAKCQACDSWLVTHRLSGSRQCHHCGYRQPLKNQCDECGTQDQMRAYGPGVERLAEEVGTLFPEARICIFSSDTAARPEVAREMIRAITENEVDIIIGTQMAAKGHHFPHLTLVGIVDADFGLQGGDLRAAERTYQMLSQAAGRAGREALKGRALLQSYEPDNAVFTALANGDRDAFLDLEIQMRQSAFMPPFGRLASIILSGVNEGEVESEALKLAKHRPAYKNVMILGPTPAPISRLRGRYRMRFLIKAPRDVHIQQILREWVESCRLASQIYMQIDIDPYSFM